MALRLQRATDTPSVSSIGMWRVAGHPGLMIIHVHEGWRLWVAPTCYPERRFPPDGDQQQYALQLLRDANLQDQIFTTRREAVAAASWAINLRLED